MIIKRIPKDIGLWVISLGLLIAVDSLMAASSKAPTIQQQEVKTEIPKVEISTAMKEIFSATQSNDVKKLKSLIKKENLKSADVKDQDGTTLLQTAMISESLQALQEILKLSFDQKTLDQDGRSYLDLAVSADSEEVLAIVLKSKKIDVNTVNAKGNSGLHTAVENNFNSRIKTLIAAGTKKDIKNLEGKTALDLAKAEGNKKAEALLK